MKYALWSGVVLTCLLISKPSSAKQSSASQKTTQASPKEHLPFESARNMTVAVLLGDFANARHAGSAVWVGNSGYLATCSHVIGDWKGPIEIGMARDPYVAEGPLKITVSNAMNTFRVSLVANDASTDVAILKAELKPSDIRIAPLVTGGGPPSITPQPPLKPKGAELDDAFPDPGQTVLLAGYPLEGQLLILQTGIATGLELMPPNPKQKVNADSDLLRIMLSLVSNPGNSGGPVFDEAGRIVGLLEGNFNAPIRDENGQPLFYMRPKTDDSGKPLVGADGKQIQESALFSQNSGISFAVPSRFILRLAQAHQITLN